jgi:hypothetical protein
MLESMAIRIFVSVIVLRKIFITGIDLVARYFNFDRECGFWSRGFRVAALVKSTGKFTKSERLRPAVVTIVALNML